MKIGLLGMGPTKDDAPYDDPDWEFWGLPWSAEWVKCSRLFEMHDWRVITKIQFRPDDYRDRLESVGVPVYMQTPIEGIPNSTAFPLEEVNADLFKGFPKGVDYYESSLSYLLAMAIHERPEAIGLWGFDLHGMDAWSHQRPNAEFLLGIALARGIELVIPEKSALLAHNPIQQYGKKEVIYPVRYGWLKDR